MRACGLLSKELIVNHSVLCFRRSSWGQVLHSIWCQCSPIAMDRVTLAWRLALTKWWDQLSFWCKAEEWQTTAFFSSGPLSYGLSLWGEPKTLLCNAQALVLLLLLAAQPKAAFKKEFQHNDFQLNTKQYTARYTSPVFRHWILWPWSGTVIWTPSSDTDRQTDTSGQVIHLHWASCILREMEICFFPLFTGPVQPTSPVLK